MKHFGLKMSGIFYSFNENCYYFAVYDNRIGKEIWKKCPFDDIVMQEKMVFLYLIEPDNWVFCRIYETCFDMETGSYDIFNKWKYEWDDYDEDMDRTEFVENIFKEKINTLKAKYPLSPFAPAA